MWESNSASSSRLCFAVGLSTLATLLLELSLTRIFSVVLFYHFAFLAISIALFGLGAGGIASYWVRAKVDERQLWRRLGALSVANGFVIMLVLWLVLRQPLLTPTGLASSLVMVYVLCSIPFFISGTIVSCAIAASIQQISRVYFYDLIGAAAGCLLLVPILNSVGGPGAVLTAGALFALAGVMWFAMAGAKRLAAATLAAAALLAIFVPLNGTGGWIDVRYAKGLDLSREIFAKWNSFSRVTVDAEDQSGKKWIKIDSDAATAIAAYDFDPLPAEDREELMGSGPGLPYLIRPAAKTLIIGAGGGEDVSRALAGGSSDISAVEINPIIARDVMQQEFAEASHRIYFRPEVRVIVEDGRSYIHRTDERYDVIQMTLVDSWASTAAGAFALAENHLYTVEAYDDYLDHLTDDGMIAVTRWLFAQPRESLRVVSLGREALRRHGNTDPQGHFIVAQDEVIVGGAPQQRATILIKREPFTAEQVERAREAIESRAMRPVYLPGVAGSTAFHQFLANDDPAAFAAAYPFDISPVDDNRPFFFYSVRLRDMMDVFAVGGMDAKINLGLLLLLISLVMAVLGTAVILFLPAAAMNTRVPQEKLVWAHLGYFFAIGVGFILIEIALVQRIGVFLGQPTYALTVVIFSLLLSTGIGSRFSADLLQARDSRLMAALGGSAIVAVVLGVGAPSVLETALSWPNEAKWALVALMLAPAGLLMGMAFPTGLRRLEQSYPEAVGWAWAVNAAASVLGSVLAIFLSIHVGIGNTVLLGGACYLGAIAAVLATQEQVAVEASGTAIEEQASQPVHIQ